MLKLIYHVIANKGLAYSLFTVHITVELFACYSCVRLNIVGHAGCLNCKYVTSIEESVSLALLPVYKGKHSL